MTVDVRSGCTNCQICLSVSSTGGSWDPGAQVDSLFKWDEIENKMAHMKASHDTCSQTSQSPKGSDCFHTTPQSAVVSLVRQ